MAASVVIALVAIGGLIYREFADEPAVETIDEAAKASVLANSVAVLPFAEVPDQSLARQPTLVCDLLRIMDLLKECAR